MGNGGQEGGLGIVKGTKPLVLFLKKDLLLIVFFQMKIGGLYQSDLWIQFAFLFFKNI